jgi:hypothetical protein
MTTRWAGEGQVTRRVVLSSVLGIGSAAVLGGCMAESRVALSASSATILRVNFGQTAFFPLLKSKIGVGRALDSSQILDSLPFLDQIRPALYNGELRFPDTTWPSLQPYPIEVGANGAVQVRPNAFLDTLNAGLRKRNIEIMDQLEGAPTQWLDQAAAKAPRNFPLPTNLTAAAHAVGEWAALYDGAPVSWCIWNEPSHNLTGSANLASVNQIADLYQAYTSAIGPHGLFGLASFVPEDARALKGLGGRTYLQAVLEELRQRRKASPGLWLDYLTMNNYGEDVQSVINGARDALGTDFNTVALVQAQFGVFRPGTWEKSAGTTLEAARSMAALNQALQIPDLQTFTFSGWIPHLIDFRGGKALQMPLFNALKLYARMPDLRVPVQGSPPSGVGVMASGDADRSSVMVWNETSTPQNVTLALTGIPKGGQGGIGLRVYHIDAGHGSPLEHGGGAFTASQTVNLPAGTGSLSKTVTVAGPGIVYVEIGPATPHPVLDRTGLAATLVRKHSYAHRTAAKNGTTAVLGDAYGSYDAVRAIAYLGIKGAQGTALTGAEYSGLPATLPLTVWTELPAAPAAGPEALLGVRVDYIVGGAAAKSVLWHGDIFNARRTTSLPWGRGGATADVLRSASALNRAPAGQHTLDLALAANAPTGWARAGSRAIISFWMDSAGAGSQARFLLG